MSPIVEILQMAGAFVLAVLVRLLLLGLVVALFSVPIVLFYGLALGWGTLREHLAGFIRVGNRFLGGRLGDVYQVNLEQEVQEGSCLEEA